MCQTDTMFAGSAFHVLTTRYQQEAQLMLTTGSTRLAVSRGQQTWYHSTCNIVSYCAIVTLFSQNFEIRSRDPGHAHLGVVLLSGRSRDASSMSMPNLKRIALFLQKL